MALGVFIGGMSSGKVWSKKSLYLEGQTITVLPFPKAMNDVYSDEASRVRVEMAHEKGNIVEEIELPALGDKRIPQ